MPWNHKVLHRIYKAKSGQIDTFEICEAYTDPVGWTGPVAPFGESLESLKWELESMLRAVDRALNGEDPITEVVNQ